MYGFGSGFGICHRRVTSHGLEDNNASPVLYYTVPIMPFQLTPVGFIEKCIPEVPAAREYISVAIVVPEN